MWPSCACVPCPLVLDESNLFTNSFKLGPNVGLSVKAPAEKHHMIITWWVPPCVYACSHALCSQMVAKIFHKLINWNYWSCYTCMRTGALVVILPFTHSLIHSFDRCYIQSHKGLRISSRRVLEYHHTLSAWTYYRILTHSLTLTHFFLPDLIYLAARCILILACSPDTSLKKALSSKHKPTQNKTE